MQAGERAAPTSTPTHLSAGRFGVPLGFQAGKDWRMLVAYLGFDAFIAHHVHLFSFGPVPSSFETELPSTRQFPQTQGEQPIPGSHCHSSRRGNLNLQVQ